jgi:hypothetical protein
MVALRIIANPGDVAPMRDRPSKNHLSFYRTARQGLPPLACRAVRETVASFEIHATTTVLGIDLIR